MHLTPTQVWQLREIARGYGTFTNLKKWDNRALGGMFRREFFLLDAGCNATITQLGWDVYQKTTSGVMRKNFNAPLFKQAHLREARRRHA